MSGASVGIVKVGAEQTPAAGEQTPTNSAAQQTETEPLTAAQEPTGTDTQAPAEGGEQAAATSEGETTPAPAPKSPHVPDWRDKRLAKKTDEVKRLEAELAKLKAAGPQAQTPGGESAAELEARINAEAERRAQALAQTKEFDRRTREAQEAGHAAYGKAEFDGAVGELVKLVDTSDPTSRSAYGSFIQAALETGECPKLVYMLGQDLVEAERIMNLSPVQQGIALARLAAKDAPKPSSAPKPITPIGSKGDSRTPIDPSDKSSADSLSTAEWMKRRNAAIKEGGARGVRL